MSLRAFSSSSRFCFSETSASSIKRVRSFSRFFLPRSVNGCTHYRYVIDVNICNRLSPDETQAIQNTQMFPHQFHQCRIISHHSHITSLPHITSHHITSHQRWDRNAHLDRVYQRLASVRGLLNSLCSNLAPLLDLSHEALIHTQPQRLDAEA